MTIDLFVKQHVLLKLCFVILTFLVVLLLQTRTIGYIILLNIVFFLPDKGINILYFRTVLRLSFFWILYLFSGVILNIPYYVQIDFLLKVLIMIQMSVFLLKSITFEYFLNDTKALLKYKSFLQAVHFIVFFNRIYKYMVEFYDNSELSKLSLSKEYLMQILMLVESLLDDMETIKARLPMIDVEEINSREQRAFCTWGNLYLIIMIMIYLLALII